MKDYHYIWIPFLTLFCTQLIKFLLESAEKKRFVWNRFFSGSGGMPSSHTAFTFSLAGSIGIGEGFSSPIFAIALVFSLVTAYDAMGLRMEAGKQASRINLLSQEIWQKNLQYENLKEQLGHDFTQVLAGAIFGLAMSFFFMWLI